MSVVRVSGKSVDEKTFCVKCGVNLNVDTVFTLYVSYSVRGRGGGGGGGGGWRIRKSTSIFGGGGGEN